MRLAAHKQRPPLHPLERTYLAVVLVQLIFMPWAFGSMHEWSQVTALGLGVLGLGVALWPRTYTGDHVIPVGSRQLPVGSPQLSDSPSSVHRLPLSDIRLNPWPRLLRFPLFWLGAALLGLLLVQAANPAWVWQRDATRWWLRRVPSISYLPNSINAPFERFNVWRHFIIYAIVWVTVCGLWIGLTRRKSLHILLGVLAGNAVILGLVGFIHKASHEPKLLWLKAFPQSSSFASFVYQNHGGAYFSLMSFLALGLAVWHFFEARKRMARSSPSALWVMAALLLVFAVIFSLSRGAIISLVVFGLAAMVALVILRLTTVTQSTTPKIITVMVALGIIGTMGWMVREIDFSAVYSRFEQFSKLQANDPSYLGRKLARESATKMYQDYWVLGVGAGGFRHLFPQYIKDKPMIYDGGRLFWAHAHIDWLEIPIELGVPGVLLLLGAAGWMIGMWLRRGGWRHPLALMVAIGAMQIMAHALIDFPFQCPAILTTWWALLVISLRWLELEAPQGSGSGEHGAAGTAVKS